MNSKSQQIINQLISGEKTLTELSKIIGVKKPTMLKYLDELENKGMISSTMKITNIGREKRYNISSYSQIISLDPMKGIISFRVHEPMDLKLPLVGQIHQQEYRRAIKIYVKKILKNFKSKLSIIIFGSVARGEASGKSDLDILLLGSKQWDEITKNKIMDALYEGVVETQLQAKPLFRTLNEFINKDDSIIREIKKDGSIIFDSLDSDDLWKTMQRYRNFTN